MAKAKSTLASGSGKATANGSWADAEKPKAASENDCTVAGTFALEWNSTEPIESLTVASGATLSGTTGISIGTANEPPTGVALSVAAGATITYTGLVTFDSTAAATVTVALGGHALTNTTRFLKGKYKLESDAKLATGESKEAMVEEGASLNLNGKNVETWKIAASTGATIAGGAGSTITIITTGVAPGEGFMVPEGTTIEGAPSVVFTSTANPSNARQLEGRSHSFTTVTLATYTTVTGGPTITTWNLNNKAKPTTCKATLVSGSNHLVVTEGEANLLAKAEVTGTAIPTGAVLVKKIEAGVWEMSANASETVVVAETVTVYNPGVLVSSESTVTVTNIASTGTEAEPARIAAATNGSAWKMKLPGNRELTAFVRVKDLSVEGGTLYLPHGINCGGNTNVLFEAEPGGGPVTVALSPALSASSASMALFAPTRVPLLAAASASGASMAMFAPTSVSLAGAASGSSASLALNAPTQVPLVSGSSSSAATLALFTPGVALVPLSPASSASSGVLALSAATQVPLAAGASASSATAAVSVATQIVLAASASLSAASGALFAPTQMALASAAALSASSAALTVPTVIPLAASAAASSASVALTASAQIVLGAAGAVSAATLAVFTLNGAVIAPNPAASTSSALLTVTVATQVPLAAGGSSSSATVGVSAPTQLGFSAASAASAASMVLAAASIVVLAPAGAASSATLGLRVSAQVPLQPASSVSAGALAVKIPVAIVLAPASSVSSAQAVVIVHADNFPARMTVTHRGAVTITVGHRQAASVGLTHRSAARITTRRRA